MFFNLQITNTDSTPAISAFSFDSIEAAKSNHHSFMASCYANTTLSYFMGEIVDERGACVACESWRKPEPAPEIEENDGEIAE